MSLNDRTVKHNSTFVVVLTTWCMTPVRAANEEEAIKEALKRAPGVPRDCPDWDVYQVMEMLDSMYRRSGGPRLPK